MSNKAFVSESKLWISLLHRFADLVVILLAAYLASALAYGRFQLVAYLDLTVALGMVVALWLYPVVGLYRSWRGESLIKELSSAVQAWTLNTLFVALLLYITGYASTEYLHFFMLWYLLGIFGAVAMRTLARFSLNKIRALGRNKTHIIVVGDNGLSTQMINVLQHSEWMGFNVVGYFGKETIPGQVCLGGFEEINDFLEGQGAGVDQVWIAMPLSREREIKQVLDQLRFATQDVRMVPSVDDFRLINGSVAQIADMPVLNLQVSPMRGMNRFIKGVEDRFLAALILVFISPLLLVLAIGVKLSSPGPVFYRQERISRGGKPFLIYKFRSMSVGIESTGVQWGGARDKTSNLFGNFIRRCSLDELPQFINVLKGEMSIVGPRPERTQFVNEFKHSVDGYMQKHMVKAGITGWAQVNGWRGDTDLNKRIECDLHYIKNWSLWLDVKIILMTLLAGFVNKNAN
ncbi:MAG: undecaprenyl-phosphate glucose phosphotransferase [Spongiibacteraceae bacterium]